MKIITVEDGDSISLLMDTEKERTWLLNGKEQFYFNDISRVYVLTPRYYRELMCFSWLPRMLRRWTIVEARIIYRKLKGMAA